MKKLVALVMLVLGGAIAAPNPDQLAICYLFSKNKVLKTGPCVVSSGDGAGGTYATYTFLGKKYETESATEPSSTGVTRTLWTTLNGKDAIEYVRDARWYNIIKGERYGDMAYLYCVKTPDGKIDICVKYQN